MARIFVTGSADGLGQMAARLIHDFRYVPYIGREAAIELSRAARYPRGFGGS
jgi:hypothetical protein